MSLSDMAVRKQISNITDSVLQFSAVLYLSHLGIYVVFLRKYFPACVRNAVP